MVKRAWLYLTRKSKRSLLLLILMFVISLSLAIGMSIWNNINSTTKEIEQALGTSITFKISDAILKNPSSSEVITAEDGSTYPVYNGPELNKEIINQILSQVDGISDFNADSTDYFYVNETSLIPGLFESSITLSEEGSLDQQISEVYTQVAAVCGNEDTSLYHRFRTGAFELVDGRHIIHGDRNKALISDEVAKLNNLTIGDSLTLSCKAGQLSLENAFDTLGDPITLEIVGIFHVNGYQPMGKWVAESDITYNYVFTDLETVSSLYTSSMQDYFNAPSVKYKFDNVTFFVENPSQLESVLEQIKSVDGIDTQGYDISIDDTMYKSTVDPLNSIRNLVAGLVLIIVIGCSVVLCIVFTMWVRSRRNEIALYLSIGISKATILGQFILEAGITALLASMLSFAACQQAPDIIGNQMLSSVVASAQPIEQEHTQEEIRQAAISGTTDELFSYDAGNYAGPEEIDFSFGFIDLIILLGIELVIIVAVICKAGWFIFDLQPKQILTSLR